MPSTLSRTEYSLTGTSLNKYLEAGNEELVVAAQEGETEAFGELASRFQRMVYIVCMQRLRDHAEAQEVSQDVLIKAFEKLYQLQEPAAFPGWLRSIAVRQSINRCTRRPPTIAVEPHTIDRADTRHAAPFDSLMADERCDQLHDGLDRLASMDRSTLVAFYLDGQTLIEMSNEFSAPIGTIKRRLHVARKRLAKELECLQAV